MKTIFYALAMTGASLSAWAVGPNTDRPELTIYEVEFAEEGELEAQLKNTVATYIENFLERDYEEMKSVLHRNFTNQGLNNDGKMTPLQNAEDLKNLMTGQEVYAPDRQNNVITITGITENTASVYLETGTEVARWKEYITLEKVGDDWKVKKVFWSY